MSTTKVPNSAQKKGKRQVDGALLNFHFERAPVLVSSPTASSYSKSRQQPRVISLTKEKFLQANFKFIVGPFASFLEPCFYDPNAIVPWDLVECVVAPEPIGQAGSCPICLCHTRIPRMTKCGHIFCYTCILRYMAVNTDSYQKCPLCAAYFRRGDLKAVKYTTSGTAVPQSEFLFRLLRVSKNTLSPHFPPPDDDDSLKKGSSMAGSGRGSQLSRGNSATATGGYSDQVPRGPVVGAAVDLSTLFCGIDEHAAPIPMDGRARGRYSRLVYATTQRFQQIIQEERRELQAYREECLNHPHGAPLPLPGAVLAPTATFTQQPTYAAKSISGSAVEAFPPLSPAVTASVATAAIAALPCKESSVMKSNNNSSGSACEDHMWEQFGEGDVEYLPAIGEALVLLYEREQAFHMKCASFGVDCSGEFVRTEEAEVGVFTMKANESALQQQKSKKKNSNGSSGKGSKGEKKHNKDDASINKARDDAKVTDTRDDAEAAEASSSIVELTLDESTSESSRPNEEAELTESSIPTEDSQSTTSSATISAAANVTTVSSEVTAATAAAAAAENSSSNNNNHNEYYIYQSLGGDTIFLHPLCVKCLLAAANGDAGKLPQIIKAPVVEVETMRVSAALKQRLPFIRHLPEYCDIVLVEIDLRNLVPSSIISQFQAEFSKRTKKRKDKLKLVKRDKLVDQDYMLAKAIYLSDTRAVLDDYNAREAAQLKELLNGPVLGTRTTASGPASEESPEVDGISSEERSGGAAIVGTDATSQEQQKHSDNHDEKRDAASSSSAAAVAKEERSFAKITQMGGHFPPLGETSSKSKSNKTIISSTNNSSTPSTSAAAGNSSSIKSAAGGIQDAVWGRGGIVAVPTKTAVATATTATAPSSSSSFSWGVVSSNRNSAVTPQTVGTVAAAAGNTGGGSAINKQSKKGVPLFSNSSTRNYR